MNETMEFETIENYGEKKIQERRTGNSRGIQGNIRATNISGFDPRLFKIFDI